MPVARRVAVVALLLGLLSSAVAPLANAEPRDPSIKDIPYLYVAIHLHADKCYPHRPQVQSFGDFGKAGSSAECIGTLTEGHTGAWNGPKPGYFVYSPASAGSDAVVVEVVSSQAKEHTVMGRLSSRGSGKLFLDSPYIDPNRPANTVGGPLAVNVAAFGGFLLDSGGYDVYINGYVPAGDRAAP